MSEQHLYTQTDVPPKVTPEQAAASGPATVAAKKAPSPQSSVRRVRGVVVIGMASVLVVVLLGVVVSALVSSPQQKASAPAPSSAHLPAEGEVKPPEEVTTPRAKTKDYEAQARGEAPPAEGSGQGGAEAESLEARDAKGPAPAQLFAQSSGPAPAPTGHGQPGQMAGPPAPKSIWAQAAEGYERQVSQNFYQDKLSSRRMGLRVNLEQMPQRFDQAYATEAADPAMQPALPYEPSHSGALREARAASPGQSGGVERAGADAITMRESWQARPRESGQVRFVPGVGTRARGMLRAGTVLELVLETAILSELPGVLRARLVRPVHDPMGGVLLEAGTMFLGEYNARVESGSERVQLVWTRAITPAGMSYGLGAIPGTDRAGASGSAAQVDRHWGELIGGALVSSLLSGGQALAQGNTNALVQTPRQAFAQGVFAASQDTTRQITQRDVQRAPLLRVPAGTHMAALVHEDLMLGGMQ